MRYNSTFLKLDVEEWPARRGWLFCYITGGTYRFRDTYMDKLMVTWRRAISSQQLAQEMLIAFSLEKVAESKSKTLSGGMQRRLSIAMALISSPQILFLDEPTLGLDVLARRELWSAIRKIKGRATIILTTHYLEEAQELADRIGIMAKGKLVAEGTVPELVAQAGTKNFEDAFIAFAAELEVLV